MTKWEYKILHRRRELKPDGYAGNWDSDITKDLAELGEKGWELVAVEPRCDNKVPGVHPLVFGATTSENWILKRPEAD